MCWPLLDLCLPLIPPYLFQKNFALVKRVPDINIYDIFVFWDLHLSPGVNPFSHLKFRFFLIPFRCEDLFHLLFLISASSFAPLGLIYYLFSLTEASCSMICVSLYGQSPNIPELHGRVSGMNWYSPTSLAHTEASSAVVPSTSGGPITLLLIQCFIGPGIPSSTFLFTLFPSVKLAGTATYPPLLYPFSSWFYTAPQWHPDHCQAQSGCWSALSWTSSMPSSITPYSMYLVMN